MSELRARIEITKLARELDVEETELDHLSASSPEELRELRRVTGAALFGRHEARLRMLASASGILPAGVTAKIAENAMGPRLSARLVSVMEPEAAARVAGHVSPEFLAALAVGLDPHRVAPILALLPGKTMLDIARRLIRSGQLIALARFVAVVDADIMATIAEEASGTELLQIVLYADEETGLATLFRRLPEPTLAEILDAAQDDEERDVVLGVLAVLDPEARDRVLAAAGR